MHKLQMYESLRDMLEREVKAIEKQGDLDVQSLDHLYKLMTALKVTDRCIEREQGKEGGMSQMGGGMSNGMSNNSYGYANRGGSYGNSNNSYDGSSNMSNDYSNRMPNYAMDGGSYGGSYGHNSSYGQGGSYDGMSNDGRRGRDGDGDGRYSEDSFRYSQNRGGNSYENSYEYSRDASKKKMVQKLETLMDDTMSEHERKAIMDCIEKIK